MLAAIIISGIIAVIIIVGIIAVFDTSDDICACQTCAFLGFLLALSIVIFGCAIKEYTNLDIKAMDVYQGKTTLKYEIVDGVKVDSTVVRKM